MNTFFLIFNIVKLLWPFMEKVFDYVWAKWKEHDEIKAKHLAEGKSESEVDILLAVFKGDARNEIINMMKEQNISEKVARAALECLLIAIGKLLDKGKDPEKIFGKKKKKDIEVESSTE